MESIDDELRSLDAPFDYDTLLPVVVSLEVYLTDGEGTLLPADATPVIVTLRDGEMNELLRGAADESGHFLATLPLPGAYEDISVSVEAPGFEAREFVVREMVRYQLVSRTLVLRTEGGALGTSGIPGLADSDGDEIPDIYDAFPKSPKLAFTKKPVAGGWLTVAFEDNFPEVGDGDFNDFIARYSVVEALTKKGRPVEITVDVEAIARVAGYDHRFGIVIGHPGYSSSFTVTHRDSYANVVAQRTGSGTDSSNLVIFESTKGAFDRPGGVSVDNGYPDRLNSRGHTAEVTMELTWDGKKPVKPIEKTPKEKIDKEKEKIIKKYLATEPPYDPYLYIHETTFDVHLVGRNSLPKGETNNPPGSDGFRDANGYPRALLVPYNWGYPIETRHIELAYPRFETWRTSDGTKSSNWYLFPQKNHVIFID
jgi:hypothetical protein